MVQSTANPTALETATVTFTSLGYFLAQFTADSVTGSGTPDAMLPNNPFSLLQVGSSISCLRSGTNQTDMANRPIITRVSFVNPSANAALAPNLIAANLAANARHFSGRYTVTAADVTATKSTISTPLTLNAVNLQVTRGGNVVTVDAAISTSGKNILLASGSTYTLTAGDLVNWFASGI